MTNEQRVVVVCAAIRLRDGRIVCGVRHFDELMRANLPDDPKLLTGAEQGFVDNRYMFLRREEAYHMALRAGQVDPNAADYSGMPGTLFSEDLY